MDGFDSNIFIVEAKRVDLVCRKVVGLGVVKHRHLVIVISFICNNNLNALTYGYIFLYSRLLCIYM